jgi:hypothetical protein
MFKPQLLSLTGPYLDCGAYCVGYAETAIARQTASGLIQGINWDEFDPSAEPWITVEPGVLLPPDQRFYEGEERVQILLRAPGKGIVMKPGGARSIDGHRPAGAEVGGGAGSTD